MITQQDDGFGQVSFSSQCDRRLDALGTHPVTPAFSACFPFQRPVMIRFPVGAGDAIATHEPSTAARDHAGGPARVGRLRGAGSAVALVTAWRARMAVAVTWAGGASGGFQ
jgi:hypothetical protein